MKMSVKVEGLKDLEYSLEQLGEKLSTKVLRKAGRAAMQPVLDDMKENAGYDVSHQGEHMRDSIKIYTISRFKEGKYPTIMTVKVGPSKPHYMKAKAQEFGTSKQVPAPFIRPALDYNQQTVLKILIDEIRHELNHR